ncbi:MAG: Dps family protein [Planctomycetota bacterium]
MADLTAPFNLLLADYQLLYQKLRAFHWNVTGPHFFGLHAKFEELYNQVALTVDEVAERILTIGGKPLSTLAQNLEHARLQEAKGDESADQMVESVIADFRTLIQEQRSLAAVAEEAGDTASADMIKAFADDQEKTCWMLRAFSS